MGKLRLGSIYPPYLYIGGTSVTKVMYGIEQVWPDHTDMIKVTVHYISKQRVMDRIFYVKKDFSDVIAWTSATVTKEDDSWYISYTPVNLKMDRYRYSSRVDCIDVTQVNDYSPVIFKITEGYVLNMMYQHLDEDEFWIYLGDDTRALANIVIDVEDDKGHSQTVTGVIKEDLTGTFDHGVTSYRLISDTERYVSINGLNMTEYKMGTGKILVQEDVYCLIPNLPGEDVLHLYINENITEYFGPENAPGNLYFKLSYTQGISHTDIYLNMIKRSAIEGESTGIWKIRVSYTNGISSYDEFMGTTVKFSDGWRLYPTASFYNDGVALYSGTTHTLPEDSPIIYEGNGIFLIPWDAFVGLKTYGDITNIYDKPATKSIYVKYKYTIVGQPSLSYEEEGVIYDDGSYTIGGVLNNPNYTVAKNSSNNRISVYALPHVDYGVLEWNNFVELKESSCPSLSVVGRYAYVTTTDFTINRTTGYEIEYRYKWYDHASHPVQLKFDVYLDNVYKWTDEVVVPEFEGLPEQLPAEYGYTYGSVHNTIHVPIEPDRFKKLVYLDYKDGSGILNKGVTAWDDSPTYVRLTNYSGQELPSNPSAFNFEGHSGTIKLYYKSWNT